MSSIAENPTSYISQPIASTASVVSDSTPEDSALAFDWKKNKFFPSWSFFSQNNLKTCHFSFFFSTFGPNTASTFSSQTLPITLMFMLVKRLVNQCFWLLSVQRIVAESTHFTERKIEFGHSFNFGENDFHFSEYSQSWYD